ncbi:hypothetical protein N8H71_27390 [Pseudomonas koreensis]|uniref:hypothetical protein n=1 Tax=Pseudomonas koreensis TaxID=198620 RepID=UPI0021C56731|nr:hypothetical protein [Pseudomonas koreensis]MCU0075333.1 hypothetical protein [Pseudomonas koreensis]
MSDSHIQPKIIFMPGAKISIVASENNILKLLEGEIKSVEEEQKTIGITLHPTNTTKTVKIENIKKVYLDERFYDNAMIISKFYKDENGHFSIHNPNDKPPQPSQPPQNSGFIFLSAMALEPDYIFFKSERAFFFAQDQLARTVNSLKSGPTYPENLNIFVVFD